MSASLISSNFPLRSQLRALLEGEGFKVWETESLAEAADHLGRHRFRLVIFDLDSALQGRHETVKTLKTMSRAPLIALSELDEDAEVVNALEHGADDFVVTPFNPSVLLARIYANLRMIRPAVPVVAGPLVNGPVRIDPKRHEVQVKGRVVAFSPKEFELLRQLMINKGHAVPNKVLLRHVWGEAHAKDSQYLRVYVSQIRKKLEPANLRHAIYSLSREGYKMDVLADE